METVVWESAAFSWYNTRCLWWRAYLLHKTPSWTPSQTTLMALVSIFCLKDFHCALQSVHLLWFFGHCVIIKIVQSACFKLFLRRYTLFDLTGVAGKYIYLTFEAATLPFKSTVAFRGLATCIFVTHVRIVTGTEKCRCCQKCPVVRSNYKIETYNSKPELEMETECAV